MAYLIEIDDLRSHIAFPKPESDGPEVQEQAAAPAEVLKEAAPDCQQEELKLPLK
jgi:hypothetical protein